MKHILLSLVLICIAATTALCADNTDTNKSIAALKSKLKDANLTVDSESMSQNLEFVELVTGSESMDAKEKQYWLSQLPSLADKQIERMVTILKDEKKKLANLDEKYKKESDEMALRHAKERIEKVYELLKSKKYKLSNSDMDVGVEAAEVYAKGAKHDKGVISKATFVVEYAIASSDGDNRRKAWLHMDACELYVTLKTKKGLLKQEEHLQKAIQHLKKEHEANQSDEGLKSAMAGMLGALAYVEVCKKDYASAVAYADEGFSYSMEFMPHIAVNKAHALVFQNKIDDAKELYLRAINSSDKDSVMKALRDDVEELGMYGLPKDKINIIKNMKF
ncbi:MAG: hypothetical protein PHE67_03945 [Campylobacterales bacterium]|nr:hypothetical protein [Campylobacterales bacterium]